MIIGTEEHSEQGYLSEYRTSTFDVFAASFGQAVSDNPTTKLAQYVNRESAGGVRLSREDALQRAKEQGVSIGDIPEDGMNQDAVDLLIERQYQRKRRSSIIGESEGGFSSGFAEIAGGLGGSFLDPLNIAASFIPVVGQAKYAGMVAKAGGTLGRAGVRMGVGAAEGFVGAAIMEPMNYALSQELGDDYGMADSLMNLAFGTLMGGGMHMGAGALSDAINFKKGHIEPQGPIARQLDAMDPETRLEFERTALAQAVEDRPIDVSPIKQANDVVVLRQVAELDAEINNLKAQGLDAEANLVARKRSNLIEQIKDNEFKIGEGKALTPEELDLEIKNRTSEIMDSEIKTMMDEIREAEINTGLIDTAEGTKTRFYDNSFPDWYREVGVKNKEDFFKAIEKKSGPKYERIKQLAEKRLTDGYEGKTTRNLPNEEFRELMGMSRSGAEMPSIDAVRTSFDRANTQPNSRYIDENMIKKHEAEFKDTPIDMRVEEASKVMESEVEMLKELADQSGVEFAPLLKEADDLIKSADDYSKMIRAMAICATRKG